MIRRLYCTFWVVALCVTCQWMAPTRMAPMGSAWASVPGITCNATMTSISFGNVDPTSWGIGGILGNGNGNSNLTTTGFLTYYCTNTTATQQTITACFSIGNPGGATQRDMTGPGNNQLDYQIYQDAAGSLPWGSKYNTPGKWGNPYAATVSVPANGASPPVTVPVYATIDSDQAIGGILGGIQSGSYNANYGGGDVALDTGTQAGGCSGATGGGSITGFIVNANVQQTCQVTTNPMIFPTPAGSDPSGVTTSMTLTVTCSSHTGYQVGLDDGKNFDGATRHMRGGPTHSDYIGYGLYKNASYSTPWGNTKGTDTVTGTSSTQTFTVYGKINPNQGHVNQGDYFDAVTVYVYY